MHFLNVPRRHYFKLIRNVSDKQPSTWERILKNYYGERENREFKYSTKHLILLNVKLIYSIIPNSLPVSYSISKLVKLENRLLNYLPNYDFNVRLPVNQMST